MSMVPQLFTIGAIGEGTIGLSDWALSDYRSYRTTIGVLSESTIGTIGPGLSRRAWASVADVRRGDNGALVVLAAARRSIEFH